jgi:hypothetical protein
LVFGCCLFSGVISEAEAQQYPFVYIPGSPKDVTILFQDSLGRLWLGGAQAACLDGARFFFLRDYGLPAGQAYDITEDPSGAIWIGSETGVSRFAQSHVEEIAKAVALSVIAAKPDLVIAAMGRLGRGVPTTDSSLVRMERTLGGWKTEIVMDLVLPGPLTLDHEGLLVYPWVNGWREHRLDDVVRCHPPAQPVPRDGALGVFPARARCVFCATGLDVSGGDLMCKTPRSAVAAPFREAPFAGAGGRANLREAPDGSMLS